MPIRGEAGIGYVLDGGFDMPPLMLTPDEIEAAVLGAQWVAGRGDAGARRAARDLIAKIEAVTPGSACAPSSPRAERRAGAGRCHRARTGMDLARVRQWIRNGGQDPEGHPLLLRRCRRRDLRAA